MATSSRQSAGLLVFRGDLPDLEVLLAHPGGPYWSKKDAGAWTIPKGEFLDDEEPLPAAKREFEEEMGSSIDGEFLELEPLRQPSGKMIYAWAVRGDFDPAAADEQPVRDGMAAEVWATAGVSRSRSGGVVLYRRGPRQDPCRPGTVPRRAARARHDLIPYACSSNSSENVRRCSRLPSITSVAPASSGV